ncbi:RhoGAP domain-containing protein [Yersinia mollaretii]|uniref:RhoGAP domain-containing protein n=1 Tax=Yersinia mollaretii TaxID=33060 RepID=UPI00119FF00A|nr:RhoGAP domain-containing protein [Yersinia mollaretii]
MNLYLNNNSKHYYSVNNLNDHCKKQEKISLKTALLEGGGICRIHNTAKNREIESVPDFRTTMDKRIDNALFDDDITIKHDDIAMEKKGSSFFSGMITSIKSYVMNKLSLFSGCSTKIENKAPPTDNKIEIQKKAVNNLTRLINHALGDKSFFATEGIFRLSSTSTINNSIQEALSSNNDEQIIVSLKEIDSPTAVAAKIKEHLGLALSDTHKESLHEMCVVYDLAATNDKKDYLPKISELPLPLQQLMPLLAKTANNAEKNRMDATNLALVIMPRMQPEIAVNHAIPITEIMENEKTKIAAYKSFLSDLIKDYGK